ETFTHNGTEEEIAVETVSSTGATDVAGNAENATIDDTFEIDTQKPTIIAVEMFDVDGDGSIDEVLLTFNDNIVDATVTPANFTIGGTAADTVLATTSTNGTDANVANDNEITIAVAAGVVGTEAKELVYTAGTLTDDVGNAMANQTVLAGAVTDSAAPVAISAQYLDVTAIDGRVDRLDVTFSENITLTAYADGDWTIGAGTVNLANETNAVVQGGNGNSAILRISTLGDAGVTGGAVNPTYAYTNNTNNLNDGINNTPTFGAQAATDGAAPVPLGGQATYLDTNSNGTVNRVDVLFSSEVTNTLSEFEAADHVFSGTSALGAITPTAAAFAGNTLQINVTPATANVTGSAVAPNYTHTNQGTLGSVNDGLGNASVTFGLGAVNDAAAPVPLSAQYLDTNANGTVNRADVTFSAEVTNTLNEFEAGDHVFSAGSALGVITSTAAAFVGDVLQVTVTVANGNVTGSVVVPTYTYTNQATAGSVNDGLGNVAVTSGAVNNADGAPPIILSGTYTDNDNDGQVDRAVLTTTADTGIVCTAFFPTVDFTVGTAGTIGLAESLNDGCLTNGTTNIIIAGITSLADTTGGPINPIVTYTQPGNGVEDGDGNDIPTANNVTLTDAARPRVSTTTATTIDWNNDGFVDGQRVTFTEAVDDSTLTGFTAPAADIATVVFLIADGPTNTYTVETIDLSNATGLDGNVDDNVLVVKITNNQAGFDTGDVTDLTITGSTLADLVGNVILDHANGDIAEQDGAAPIITLLNPPHLSTGIPTTQLITITFSEAMTQGSMASSSVVDDPGGWTFQTWTLGDTRVELVHNNFLNGTVYDITPTGTDASAQTVALSNGTIVPIPFRFTTAFAGGGGGTGASHPPSVIVSVTGDPSLGLTIDGGAESTASLDVMLNLDYQNVLDMRFANSAAELAAAPWQNPVYTKTWRLAEGPAGSREVFVEGRGYEGADNVTASDSINYQPPAVEEEPTEEDELVPPAVTQLMPGELLKGASSSAVYYYASDGGRYVFFNETIFFT
ncbi:MAG TPA: Ig-like domain-containing protein, partial [Candidatus Saccharimonadales bacterium]